MERSTKSVADLIRLHRQQEDSDELKELFQTSRIRNRKQGVSPFSLLTSGIPQQVQVLTWLMRRQEATLTEIQEAMGQKINVAAVLESLKLEGRICERLENGQIYYRTQLASRESRQSEAMGDVWSRLDQDKVRFLRELALFDELTAAQVSEIADQMELREYNRNDVLLWQGQASKILYIIKSGVVGISYLSADMQEAQRLAYLKQGDILGEYNLMMPQDFTATASATALSTVEALLIPHDNFRALMKKYPSVLWGMSEMLVQRLIAGNPKRNETATRLSLVVGVRAESGRTIVGSTLAEMLGRDQTAVYTEYPSPQNLIQTFNLKHDETQDFYLQQEGFDIAVSHFTAGLPLGLKVSMLYEQLAKRYANIVIGIPTHLDEGVIYLLERANQVVILTTPDAEAWAQAEEFQKLTRPYLHPEKSVVFRVVNCYQPQWSTVALPAADFVIPYEANFSHHSDALREIMSTIADRLGRTNQVSLYIPTTVDVNKAIDTSPYVQKTLSFLGQRFGGATSSEAQGVWNSEEMGLVAEKVFIVRSYATKNALDKYLSEILTYVEQMKKELLQEAMAVEVNQKLMLI